MKAKVYLKKIRKMDAMINADIEELAQLEALATKTVRLWVAKGYRHQDPNRK